MRGTVLSKERIGKQGLNSFVHVLIKIRVIGKVIPEAAFSGLVGVDSAMCALHRRCVCVR